MMDATEKLADRAKNYYGYKAVQNSISDQVLQIAKKNSELLDVAKAMRGRVKGGSSPSFQMLRDLGAFSILRATGVPGYVASGATAAYDIAQKLGNPYEAGESMANTMAKFTAIGKMADAVGNKITSGAKSIFSANVSAVSSPISSVMTSQKSYDKRVNRIQSLAMNPQAMYDHMLTHTQGFSEAAPNVAQGVNATLSNTVQFLNSKIPVKTNPMPFDPPFEPTPMQRSRFERYYNAVNDPISALKEIKQGSLNNETMEALQAVHPQLLQEMREKVVENMQLKKAQNLTYGVKIALSKFLGQPLDSQMLPGAIQANQAALQAPEMSQNASPVKGGRGQGSAKGMQNLGLAQRSATETQDLEDDNA
jgi:hypothetical protein